MLVATKYFYLANDKCELSVNVWTLMQINCCRQFYFVHHKHNTFLHNDIGLE